MYCLARPTCNANHSSFSWIQDLSSGRHRELDPLVLGQVPGQGVSATGGTDLLLRALLLGLILVSVFA